MTSRRASLWVCGTLGKAHGLRGELYVNLAPGGLGYLQNGERFFVSGPRRGEPRPCDLARRGGSDSRPIVAVDLAVTREEAVALQGLTLLASGGPLDAVPQYRVGDLLGRRVREQGSLRDLGEVVDVLLGPAHDILELDPPGGGGPVLVPLVSELVWEDGESGLVVRDGLLDTE